MSLKAVLKVGGSLSRGDGLRPLCRQISRLSGHYSLLIVPGGGGFADQVREADRRYRIDETVAHSMALLAMDQYGYLLNQLIEGSVLTADLLLASTSAESGRAAILLPSALVLKEDPLPHSWQVTSDTIAAWVSHRAGCSRLVLLKDVDGLLGPDGLVEELTVKQLDAHAGGVDGHLSKFLSSVQLETWIINGMCSARLFELLDKNHTTGTRVASSDFRSV